MTGFSNRTYAVGNRTFSIEIRSINSRSFDFKCRLPSGLRSHEITLRKLIQDVLIRGKVDMVIDDRTGKSDEAQLLDAALISQLYAEVKAMAYQLGEPASGLLSDVLRLPQVNEQQNVMYEEEELEQLYTCLKQSCEELMEHRREEGAAMAEDMLTAADGILKYMVRIEEHETARMQQFRQRILGSLEKLMGKADYDRSRFEQEMLYYIEKLDINEEKVRLQQHLRYFEEVVRNNGQIEKGKKISFIGQEIGREINTMGSKANYAPIQHLVVGMKEELEKIKEQTLNLL